PEGPRHREPQLSHGHGQQPAEDHRLGPEAVQHHPDGDLHARVDEQLQDGEGRQLAAADVEAVRRDEAGHAERGAVEDGQDVDAEAGQPDRPRATATDVVQLSHGGHHSQRASRYCTPKGASSRSRCAAGEAPAAAPASTCSAGRPRIHTRSHSAGSRPASATTSPTASARASSPAKGAASGCRWPGAFSVSVAGPSATTTRSPPGATVSPWPRSAHSCGVASAATDCSTSRSPTSGSSPRPIPGSVGRAPSGTRPVVKRAPPEGASTGQVRVLSPAPMTTTGPSPFATVSVR